MKKNKNFAKRGSRKKVIIWTIIAMLLWILGFYLYTTYQNIEIKESNYEITKTRFHSRRTNCGIRRKK